MTGFEVNYSMLDRMVHNLAMSQFEMQKSLSNLEDRGFERNHAAVSASNPVFITSLPRAGTTLLLEIIAAAPDFVSHTYRDMPFLLCPLTWDRMSRRFRKTGEARERAHGDGMLFSYDSVEAFEEILWLAFWPEHFKKSKIVPWEPEEENEEFAIFLRQHMRKMIALRQQRMNTTAVQRYVSKNNTNIARLGWLQQWFSDATIVIPYREPNGHISSLIRQHKRFLEAHRTDPFIQCYMETIGHLEFGRALRPIDFDGWLARRSDLDPTTPAFWAEYLINAYEGVIRSSGQSTVIFSYDRLCADPKTGLAVLENKIGLEKDVLSPAAERFRPPTENQVLTDIGNDRSARLMEVVEKLSGLALF